MLRKKLCLTVFLLILLACSYFDSISTPTVGTDYYIITRAGYLAQTLVSLTQTAMPSSTPLPTKTLKPPLIMSLYDDFDNQQFDGSTSSIKWRSLFNSRCKAFQKTGSLVITDTYKEEGFISSSCYMIVAVPLYVPYDQIGSLSAKLLAKKPEGYNPSFYQTISFQTYDIKNGIVWKADCGIKADELGVHFTFNLFPADFSGQILILGWQAANYDTWYQVRMELNPDTNTIKCFVDEKLFYETLPPRLDEIRASDFFWTLSSFAGGGNLYTELWFDDVYLGK